MIKVPASSNNLPIRVWQQRISQLAHISQGFTGSLILKTATVNKIKAIGTHAYNK